MTCKDCEHYEVCQAFLYSHDVIINCSSYPNPCSYFKDKSKIIELPCKVGDVVYQEDGVRVYPFTVEKIVFDTGFIAFDENAIGKTVFLTREEAEKALKESKT